jgi:hypothetical protein
MDTWAVRQPRNRWDRNVRHARFSVAPGAPVRRLAFTIEEGLRLAALPGENEGRSYYFRTLRIAGLPPAGDRPVWLDRFQQTLARQAGSAIHAADPRAGAAEAVYFRSEEEALEILLHHVLARRPLNEWYWAQVAPAARAAVTGFAPAPDAETIRRIVEELRSRPASWLALGTALFAVPEFDVIRLFDAVSPAVASGWLREMGGQGPARILIRPAIPRAARPSVERSLRAFGPHDPRTVWLAALAVLLESPADLASKTAVARARMALRTPGFASSEKPPQAERRLDALAPPPAMEPGSAQDKTPAPPAVRAVPKDRTERIPRSTPPPASADAAALPAPAIPSERQILDARPIESAPGPGLSPPESAAIPGALPWAWVGEPTSAAGLFFLLNALERIGAARALDAFEGAVPDFAARVLRHLAYLAGASGDDPVARWLDSRIDGPPATVVLHCDSRWWPVNLPLSRSTADPQDLVRAWSAGVRRWCRRAGRLGIGDVITRGGVFAVNRTNLDVSLPLEEADVRVRRIGLDLDPGWVPWFGWVVHFHYLSPG